MNIQPYASIHGFSFGESREAALKRFGSPVKEDENRTSQKQLHYSDSILRFDSELETFIEFTALPPCKVSVEETILPWSSTALEVLHGRDSNLMDIYGAIVSFAVGVALTGFHDNAEEGKAIHVFKKGEWDSLVDKRAKNFVPKTNS